MAWALVQSKSAATAGSNSVVVSLTTAPRSGNKIIIATATNTFENPVTVKDGNAVSLTLAAATFAANSGLALYFYDVPAAISSSFTITFTTSPNSGILIQEVSGLALGNTTALALDGTVSQLAGGGSSPCNTTAYSSTAANEYLIMVAGDNGNSTVWAASATGYTGDPNNTTSTTKASIGISYKNSNNGAESGAWTFTGGTPDYCNFLVAFKLATTPKIAFFQSVSSGSATTFALSTSGAMALAIGDIVVAIGIVEDATVMNSFASNASIGSGTWQEYKIGNAASNCYIRMAYGVVTANSASDSVSSGSVAAARRHGLGVWVITGGQMAAVPAFLSGLGGTAPSQNITTVAANSFAIVAHGDFSAVAPGTPAYRNGGVQDGIDDQSGAGAYVGYWYHALVATASTVAMGQTAPTGQTPQMLGIEVQFKPDPVIGPVSDNNDIVVPGFLALPGGYNPVLGGRGMGSAAFGPITMQWMARFIADAGNAIPGNVDYAQTQTDDSGVTDNITRVAAYSQTVATDSAGLTDNIAAAQGWNRTQIDDSALTDAITQFSAAVRTITDLANPTDNITQVIVAARQLADENVGLTDFIAQTVAAIRLQIDDTGITDSVTYSQGWNRTLVDPAGTTDVVTQGVDYVRTITDPAGVTDNITQAAVYSQTEIDDSGLTDNSAYLKSINITIIDPAGVTDIISQASAAAQAFIDNANATDVLSQVATYPRTQIDDAGITDVVSQSAAGSFTQTNTDNVNPTDSITQQSVAAQIEIDNAGVTDVVAQGVDYVRTITDPAGITDNIAQAAQVTRAPVDDAGATDSTTATAAYIRSATDDAGATDSMSYVLPGSGTQTNTDNAGVTDNIAQVANYPRTQTDDAGITDNVQVARVININIIDDAGVTDNISKVSASTQVMTDNAGMTDSINQAAQFIRSQTDQASPTDNLTYNKITDYVFTDNAGVTDVITRLKTSVQIFTDDAGLTDNVVPIFFSPVFGPGEPLVLPGGPETTVLGNSPDQLALFSPGSTAILGSTGDQARLSSADQEYTQIEPYEGDS